MFSFITFESFDYETIEVIELNAIHLDPTRHEAYLTIKTRTTVQTGEEMFEIYTRREQIKGVHPDKDRNASWMCINGTYYAVTSCNVWDKQDEPYHFGY